MPVLGWDSVTVPGAVSAWVALSERFGRLPFAQLFDAAIGYARDGFHVGPKTAYYWNLAAPHFKAFPDFIAHFLPQGRAPRAGELFKRPDLARTLELIAQSRGEAFYRGELARHIVAASRDAGGVLECRRPRTTSRRLGDADPAALPRHRTARNSAERSGTGRTDRARDSRTLRPAAPPHPTTSAAFICRSKR